MLFAAALRGDRRVVETLLRIYPAAAGVSTTSGLTFRCAARMGGLGDLAEKM